jgi:hypothetical protein
MPNYPVYPSQPFTGNPPSMWSAVNRASDTRYSSGTAPYYQAKIDAAHGRHLAGSDDEVQDERAEQGYALNELRLMAEMDDVQGNGVFDNPEVTPPNIHPDAGIFQVRFSLPGYSARERMFAPSEVRDVTTGRPIIPVPNSPVAFDTNEQVAFIERGLNQPFGPVVRETSRGDMPFESITNVVQNPQAIKAGPPPPPGTSGFGQTEGGPSRGLLLAGGAAVAAGVLWYALKGSKRPMAKNRRRARRR